MTVNRKERDMGKVRLPHTTLGEGRIGEKHTAKEKVHTGWGMVGPAFSIHLFFSRHLLSTY